MSYTDKITYYDADDITSSPAIEFDAPEIDVPKVDGRSPVYRRSHEVFTQEEYQYPAAPPYLGQAAIEFPENEDVYLLRFLVKQPDSAYFIPSKIAFLQGFIEQCAAYQRAHFPDYEGRFVYLTVRSGEVKSVNDDEFHVDGFQGISVPRHIPEQNYIWASSHATLFSMQPYFIEQLDPALHNMHDYFNAQTNRDMAYRALDQGVYIMDPYHVHARPNIPSGIRRAFLRLCFSPVEIRDDSNTPNPALPRGPYHRDDIRNRLTMYKEPNGIPNSRAKGLMPVK